MKTKKAYSLALAASWHHPYCGGAVLPQLTRGLGQLKLQTAGQRRPGRADPAGDCSGVDDGEI